METAGKLEIRVDESGGALVLHAEGTIGLATAAELRASLMNALGSGGATILDAARVSAADLCGLQLLCSAVQSWRARGATFRVEAASEVLTAAARSAGIEPQEVFGREVSRE
jgi:anti-anti-sigma factor